MVFRLTQLQILARNRRVTAPSTDRCKVLTVAILLFSLLTSSRVCAPSRAAASQDDWRKMSRTARYKVDDNDYAGAVELYTRAIQTLRKADPTSEYVYDLIINLAETHMIAGKYTQALRVLETIESQIRSKTFCDPMLPARFLRRKSRVDMAIGNKIRAIDEETEMLNIVGKYFSRTSEHYQGQLRKLIELMYQGQSWRKMAAVTPMLRRTDDSIEMFSSLVEQAGLRAMKSGDLETAAKLLADAGRLYQTDERLFLLMGSWNLLSDNCSSAHRLDLYPYIEKEIRKAIKVMQPNTVVARRGRSFGHYAMAMMRQRRGDTKGAIEEFKNVTKLWPLGPQTQLMDHDYHLVVAANLNIVSDYVKGSDNLDEAAVRMQENVELTSLPRESSKIGKWNDFSWMHCMSRLHYARVCSKQQLFSKALNLLDSIDMKLAEEHPGLPDRIKTLRKAMVKKLQETAPGSTK